MKKLRPYLGPVVTLITDLVTFGWRVIRQLILPTLTRKGNLLSSLFVLFTGATEQVISCGEAVGRVPRTFELPAKLDRAWTFSRKYLRQGMLIAAWALFMLSSLEWSGIGKAVTEQTAAQQTMPELTTVEQTAAAIACPGLRRRNSDQSQKALPDNEQGIAPVARIAVHLSISPPPCSTPRWLLLRTVRI